MDIDPTKTHEILQHKHDRPLVACRFEPCGRHIFFGAEDNLVHRLDLQSKSVTPFAAHDSWVRALGFSPDGKILYSGGYDGRLIFWPATDDKPTPIRVIQAHNGWLRALAVKVGRSSRSAKNEEPPSIPQQADSPNDHLIATCGNDNLIKLWISTDGALLTTFSGHTSHVYNLAFHPSGETLVSCDLKGVLKEWDLATLTLKRDLAPAGALYKYDNTFRADIGGARGIAFRTDGNQLALSGITNVTNAFAGIGNVAVVLIDMAEGSVSLQLEAKEKINGVAWGIAHHSGIVEGSGVAGGERSSTPGGVAVGRAANHSSSDTKSFWIGLAGGGGGGWLYFWKGDTSQEFHKLKLPNDGRDLSLSPDNTQLAVAHADKILRLYALHDKSV